MQEAKICFMLLTLLMNGCAWRMLPESRWEQSRLDNKGMKQFYEFSIAKTETTGKLLIHCIPPSQQMMVQNYEIQVGNNQKLEVFKYSDVHILLDTGEHIVTINAKGFGKSSQRKILIEEGISTALTYMGPHWMWSSGTFQ